MPEIEILKPAPEEVTTALTRQLEKIGYEAWAKSMIRTTPEISQVFNEDPDHLRFMDGEYRNAARLGGLVVAYSVEGPVGFATARQQASTLPATPEEVELTKINVLPEYQRRGIGRRMLGELLRSFDPALPLVAHTLSEAEGLLHIFNQLHVLPVPAKQKPELEYWFGALNPPAQVVRHAATSIAFVLDALDREKG